jgi:uncharacterized protein (DUF924 family)
MTTDTNDILDFWFAPAHAAHWFAANAGFDEQIRQRFGSEVELAAQGDWMTGLPHPKVGWHC